MRPKLKTILPEPIRKPLRHLKQRVREERRYAQWKRIARSTPDLRQFAARPHGPRIVMFCIIGKMFLTDIELCLGLALNARGAAVEMVFDDAVLPLCEVTTRDVVEDGKARCCRQCVAHIRRMLEPVPLRARWLSELVPTDRRVALERVSQSMDLSDQTALMQLTHDGVPIGRPAYMVAMRHFRTGILDLTNPQHQSALRSYVHAGLIAAEAAKRLATESPIHAAMMSHGIYSSWEPALEMFKKHGVKVAVYDRATGKDRYQFNWDVSPNTGDISSAWNGVWRDRQLTSEERQAAIDYIADRETFKREGVRFSDAAPASPASIRQKLALPPDKTVLLLLSNLVWDAAAVGRDLIFENTMDWVRETIEVVRRQPGLFLVVKPHPAEAIRGTKLHVGEEVKKLFPTLPDNVLVLPAENDINPMSLMRAVDVGIVHTSTAGLEMAALGKPVIPVSSAHYRGKGFTFDPDTLDEYRRLLIEAPLLSSRFTRSMHELALKYTYIRYFKYQHELPFIEEKGFLKTSSYRMASFSPLTVGGAVGTDFVCATVLSLVGGFVRD